ncbi:unconventional myosin-XIX [Monomorium pharaonis]|uniref:unconventional myosin-XIX n=1 Tax=Monomorium pharaonis TaxID=307658 RepID=UPI001745D89D|nr:unconventional myosin-XIX [Monomorium pharaonis]
MACCFVQRISDACRLISAFTIAPTENNQVSSRHVQLVWLEYKTDSICGATISSYLLERDRVTKGCNNFQIFNQMMTTIDHVEFADTGLSKNTRYSLLSDWNNLKTWEFCDGFRETKRAMDTLGLTKSQKRDIFLVLSMIIHMGNIRFVQDDDYCRIDTDDQQSREALENTCRLACVKKEDLAELLTSTLINPHSLWRRHSTYRRNLNTSDACRYRLHSIIRHLYDLLFQWLINYINEILTARLYSEQLGILDSFGFECFNSNGIEQLCINYVNERLQQYFVEKHLVSYRNELEKEGLIDNQELSEITRSYGDRINTIEKYLFTTLNDMCLSAIPSNLSTLVHQVRAKICPATKRFLNVSNENFIVQHYSGIVKYTTYDLLSKNTDKIPDEIIITFSVSENNFLYSLINKSKPRDDRKAKKPTMLSKLQCNVDLLIEELNKCDVHYVRCIKPQRLNSHEWDREELRRQLINTGIFEALPLARVKYPIQFVYKDFLKRYGRRHIETYNLHIACKKILESFRRTLDDDNSSVYYGKRLIFIRESMFLRLESARKRYRAECVKKIESFWIKYRSHTQYSDKNVSNEIHAIFNTSESIEKSESETKNVMFAERTLDAGNHQLQENVKKNTVNDTQTIVKREQSQFEKSLLEYESIIPVQDIPRYLLSGKHVVTTIVRKTAYILNWLDGVKRTENSGNCTPSILKQLREDYSDQSDNINYINNCGIQSCDASRKFLVKNNNTNDKYLNNKFCMRNRRENNPGHYNEKEDMYIIQYDTVTLFYKNGILSRCHPPKLPIRIHTRPTSLNNSHYSVHTELPQGLQDCL